MDAFRQQIQIQTCFVSRYSQLAHRILSSPRLGLGLELGLGLGLVLGLVFGLGLGLGLGLVLGLVLGLGLGLGFGLRPRTVSLLARLARRRLLG